MKGKAHHRCMQKTATGMAQRDYDMRTPWANRARSDGKWVSAPDGRPLKALSSHARGRGEGYKAFRESMELHTSSQAAIYAADSTIA
jgi:hypothetical protein